MRKTLTDGAISKATKDAAQSGARIELSDEDHPGLRLRITPSGVRSWVLGARDREGRLRRFPLGSYPAIGISAARTAARKLHVEIKTGGADPIAEARRQRKIGQDAAEGIGTLTALLDIYAKKRGSDLRSWDAQRGAIDNVFAKHLNRPLATMSAADLQMTADGHGARYSAALAVRCLRPVVKWAAKRGYAPAGLADLHQPATVQRRERVLSRDELKAVLPTLRASKRPYAEAMLFMLLTLARREEVCAAPWGEIDLEAAAWTIPAERAKNGREHRVPLSKQAVKLLRSRRPAKAKADLLVFATETGASLGNWDRETKIIQSKCGITGWNRHDLRRTGATVLGELGTDPHVIEAALNHAAIHSQLASIYNRARYQQQVADALQKLADWLDGIDSGGAEVVPLRAAS
jgi:integrase